MNRCEWCGNNPLYVAYHDKEWGVPVHDDQLLFEFLLLEGFQASLSWLTILKKRDNYRQAFHAFDFKRVAKYTETDVARLLADSGIVRNRLKIESAIKNVRGVLEIQEEYGLQPIWSFGAKSIISIYHRFTQSLDLMISRAF